MRYVIVAVIKGVAGDFNNKLRKEVYFKYGAKSSKLPAHFTIKAPFEYNDSIIELEEILNNFCENENTSSFKIDGYDHFDESVIYMKVNMSSEGKAIHDRLIDELRKINYITFDKKDGKDKVFHITISSKGIKPIFNELWTYVNRYPCKFISNFENISIYKWDNNTWILHKEFLFRQWLKLFYNKLTFAIKEKHE